MKNYGEYQAAVLFDHNRGSVIEFYETEHQAGGRHVTCDDIITASVRADVKVAELRARIVRMKALGPDHFRQPTVELWSSI